jgi:ATP-dependent helicase/DNAse subunit B
LSGKIDRIDLIDEQRGLLRVYDYKTGKPKTRVALKRPAKHIKKIFQQES